MGKQAHEKDLSNIERTIKHLNDTNELPNVAEEATGLWRIEIPGFTYWLDIQGFSAFKDRLKGCNVEIVEDEG